METTMGAPTLFPSIALAWALATRSHLGYVGELGLTLGDILRGGHHAGVDDHDVGELGGEAQLDSDATVKAEVPALRQDWGGDRECRAGTCRCSGWELHPQVR